MTKKSIWHPAMLFALLFCVQAQAGSIESLRGVTELEQSDRAPPLKKYEKDGDPIMRDYVQQPPLIPHKVAGYKINLKKNRCLECHSWKNYRDAEATKISLSHFTNRNDQMLANVSPRRYFCTQCHVPQVNAPPLVENGFRPLSAITAEE